MEIIIKILEKLRLIKSSGKKLEEYLDILKIPYRNHNSQIDALTPSLVSIGNNFVSAPGSKIISHDSSLVLSEGILRFGKVKIGDNVFLGANSVVLAGSIIGNNCIIGAGAVVKGKFKDYSVIVGNPAKKIMSVQDLIIKTKKEDNFIDIPIEVVNKMKISKLSFEDRKFIEKIVNEKVHKR